MSAFTQVIKNSAEYEGVVNSIRKGFWIEINFNKIMSFKDYSFSKLIVPIKPNCNWLTFYRSVDNV